MNRKLSVALIFVCLLFVCITLNGETARASNADPALLLSENGYSLTVTDAYFTKYVDSVALKLNIRFLNTSGKEVSVYFEPVSTNGATVSTTHMMCYDSNKSVISDYQSGTMYTGAFMYIEAKDKTSIQQLLNCRAFTLRVAIKDQKNNTLYSADATIRDIAALSTTPEAWKNGFIQKPYDETMLADNTDIAVEFAGLNAERDAYNDWTYLYIRYCVLACEQPCYLDFINVNINGIAFGYNRISHLGRYSPDSSYGIDSVRVTAFDDDEQNAIRSIWKIEMGMCATDTSDEGRLLFYTPITLKNLSVPGTCTEKTYQSLKQGDTGYWVGTLQKQLIALGYLNGGSNAIMTGLYSVDGKFDAEVANAVKQFCKYNDLPVSGTATNAMQQALFGIAAVPYPEPDIALAITEDSRISYMNASNGRLKFRIDKLLNTSEKKTVKAFEMRAYAVDVWGDEIYGDGVYYYDTTTKTVAPGKTVSSVYFIVPNRKQIDLLYVGVSKIVYTDGTIREADPIEYWYFVINQ